MHGSGRLRNPETRGKDFAGWRMTCTQVAREEEEEEEKWSGVERGVREKGGRRVDWYEVSWLTRRNNGSKLAREVGVGSHHRVVNPLLSLRGGEGRALTISLFHNWSICGLTVMHISIGGAEAWKRGAAGLRSNLLRYWTRTGKERERGIVLEKSGVDDRERLSFVFDDASKVEIFCII